MRPPSNCFHFSFLAGGFVSLASTINGEALLADLAGQQFFGMADGSSQVRLAGWNFNTPDWLRDQGQTRSTSA